MSIEKKEQVEKVFEERENFINSLADKNVYGWFCEKHKVFISKAQESCPLCVLEEKNHIKYNSEPDEKILKRREKDKVAKKKKFESEEEIKKHRERVYAYDERERSRKKQHSFFHI